MVGLYHGFAIATKYVDGESDRQTARQRASQPVSIPIKIVIPNNQAAHFSISPAQLNDGGEPNSQLLVTVKGSGGPMLTITKGTYNNTGCV